MPVSIDAFFMTEGPYEIMNILEYGVMKGIKPSISAASIDHPGNDILTIMRLKIVTPGYTDDITRF